MAVDGGRLSLAAAVTRRCRSLSLSTPKDRSRESSVTRDKLAAAALSASRSTEAANAAWAATASIAAQRRCKQ